MTIAARAWGATLRSKGEPMPSFAGQGPSGYTRSDERIFEDVCEALTHDPGIDARFVRVTVQGGVVLLEGRVENRDVKYHAESVVETVRGVREIDNRLRTTVDRGVEQPFEPGVFSRLIEEHRLVAAMFDIVLGSDDAADRVKAFRSLARELWVHAHAEEEIVYHELSHGLSE